MQYIDVSDLPESVARAIEAMVRALRQQLGQIAPPAAKTGAGEALAH
jgi:hypothetical protein